VGYDPADPEGSRAAGGAGERPVRAVFPGSVVADLTGQPAAARRMLGGQLRRLREASAVNPEQAAWHIRGSRAKLSRIETGRGKVKDRDLLDLAALYGVTDAEVVAGLMLLAREGRAAEWWAGFSDVLPAWFEPYLGMEASARLIRSFDLLFVPGLFQTEAYARALTILGHRAARAGEVDRRVQVRMRRQELLAADDPPRVWAVLDEAALRRPVGGAEVMAGQLRRLLEIAGLPAVSLQVLPFAAGGHDAAGAFAILRFAEPGIPDMVYLEQIAGAAYIDKQDAVESHLDRMNRLSALALSPAETTRFLSGMLGDAQPAARRR
jgi:hypothetical protein